MPLLVPFGWPNTQVAGAGGGVGGDRTDPVEAARRERAVVAKQSAATEPELPEGCEVSAPAGASDAEQNEITVQLPFEDLAEKILAADERLNDEVRGFVWDAFNLAKSPEEFEAQYLKLVNLPSDLKDKLLEAKQITTVLSTVEKIVVAAKLLN